jgi:hypothetical protein
MAENPLKTIAKRVAHADMARRQVDDYFQYGRGEDVARLAGRTKADFKLEGSKTFKDIARETYGKSTGKIARSKRVGGFRRAMKDVPKSMSYDSPKLVGNKHFNQFAVGDAGLNVKGEFMPGKSPLNASLGRKPLKDYVVLLTKAQETRDHESVHTLPRRTLAPEKRLKPAKQKFADDTKHFMHHVNRQKPDTDYNYYGNQVSRGPARNQEAAARAVPVIRNYFRETGKTITTDKDWNKAVQRYDHPGLDFRGRREVRNVLRRSPMVRAFGKGLY